jgi:hypothetical protein
MLFVPFFNFADVSVVEGYEPMAFVLFAEFTREKLFDNDEVDIHELVGEFGERFRWVLYN